MTSHIALIVGSLRKESFNRQLAKAIVSIAPPSLSFEFLDIGALPLYSQDFDAAFPEPAVAFKQRVEAADGLLFVTPEYNRSIPGVLKNAIDWASRPWGHSAWRGKPGAIVGTSPGAVGTAAAQQHLRNVLLHLDVTLLGQPEIFLKHDAAAIDADGNILNERTRAYLQGFVDRFAAWVSQHPASRA